MPARPPALNSMPSEDRATRATYALSSAARVEPSPIPLGVASVGAEESVGARPPRDHPMKRAAASDVNQSCRPLAGHVATVARHSRFSATSGCIPPRRRRTVATTAERASPNAMRRAEPEGCRKTRRPSPSSARTALESEAGAAGVASGVRRAAVSTGAGVRSVHANSATDRIREEERRIPLLLGRYHAVGKILSALPRRVLALLELRRLLLLAFLFLLSLLKLVVRLLCHVVVKSGDVEQIGSQRRALGKIALTRLPYNAAPRQGAFSGSAVATDTTKNTTPRLPSKTSRGVPPSSVPSLGMTPLPRARRIPFDESQTRPR